MSIPSATENFTVAIFSGDKLYATDTHDHFHVDVQNRIPERFKDFYVKTLALSCEVDGATHLPKWRTLVAKVNVGQTVMVSDPQLHGLVGIFQSAHSTEIVPEQPLMRCGRPDLNNLEVQFVAQNAGTHVWDRPKFGINNDFADRSMLVLQFTPITKATVQPQYQYVLAVHPRNTDPGTHVC